MFAKMKGVLVAALLTAAPGIAHANCTQPDVAGTWQAYAISASNAGAYWVRCRVSINASGNVANSPCTDSNGGKGTLTNGTVQLKDPNSCTFTGKFTLGGTVNTIRHATMALDKISVEGVGTFPGGIFSVSLTKL